MGASAACLGLQLSDFAINERKAIRIAQFSIEGSDLGEANETVTDFWADSRGNSVMSRALGWRGPRDVPPRLARVPGREFAQLEGHARVPSRQCFGVTRRDPPLCVNSLWTKYWKSSPITLKLDTKNSQDVMIHLPLEMETTKIQQNGSQLSPNTWGQQ